MTKVTIDFPNDIPLTPRHSEAAIQAMRVVNAMAQWFGADVQAAVAINTEGGGNRNVLSFSFTGERATQAAENVGFFLENNPDIKRAYIKPSAAEKIAGGATSVKMNLDTLSQYKPNDFDMAAYDAGHNGSIVSRRVSSEEGRAKGS